MGMNLLLKLCIHPDVAVSVWETMEERGVGNTGIGELLSTHPNSSSRRKKLQNLVPKLESEYDIRCGSIMHCIVCRFSVRVDVPIAEHIYQTLLHHHRKLQ